MNVLSWGRLAVKGVKRQGTRVWITLNHAERALPD